MFIGHALQGQVSSRVSWWWWWVVVPKHLVNTGQKTKTQMIRRSEEPCPLPAIAALVEYTREIQKTDGSIRELYQTILHLARTVVKTQKHAAYFSCRKSTFNNFKQGRAEARKISQVLPTKLASSHHSNKKDTCEPQ